MGAVPAQLGSQASARHSCKRGHLVRAFYLSIGLASPSLDVETCGVGFFLKFEAWVLKFLLRRRQFPNPDIPEPNLAVMILQQNVPFYFIPKSRRILELAFGNRAFLGFAAAGVIQHLGPIQPVLDLVSLNHNS